MRVMVIISKMKPNVKTVVKLSGFRLVVLKIHYLYVSVLNQQPCNVISVLS